MGTLVVSRQLTVRDRSGAFIADCAGAASKSIAEAIQQGAAISRSMAPVKTGTLAGSIAPVQLSRTTGVWGTDIFYAMYQEKGAGPHEIPSRVSFYWERMGRQWMWPETYLIKTGFPGADPINHPGNPAQPFLEPAYDMMKHKLVRIMAKYYPS